MRTTPDAFERLHAAHWPQARAMMDALLVHRPGRLAEMTAYHLDTGGKRLRAVLPLWVAEALDVDPAKVVPLAAACEMLHNATLVHDDLQDGDTVRRGQPTVWCAYGSAQAINAGDAMYHLALQLALRVDAPPHVRQRLVERMLGASLDVIDGQVGEFDLAVVPDPTAEDYVDVVEGKTSGLFELPVVATAELCGAAADQVEALSIAARHLGVLFQVQDDLLDLYGKKGRSEVASDLREGKISLLVVHALEHAESHDASWLRDMLRTARESVTDTDVARALALLESTGARTRALHEIGVRREAIAAALRPIAHAGLRQVFDTLVERVLGPIAHLSPPCPHEDLVFCQGILPEVSRTFAVSIELLPTSLREAVRVGYLLCRILDTIEDDPRLQSAARDDLFDAFDAALSGPSWRVDGLLRAVASHDPGVVDAERRLLRRADAVFRRWWALPASQRDGMRTPILEMSRGMRECAREAAAQGGLHIADVAALERYCYFVAGTVGELLTHLFLDTVPEVAPAVRTAVQDRAVPFGLALQIVNIVKDTAEDQVRGVTFLPASVLAEFGLRSEDLFDPAHRDQALAAVRAVCGVARGHLDTAMDYTSQWPADSEAGVGVRMFCLVPLILAAETLTLVEQGNSTLVPGRTPKVSRDVVARVLEQSAVASRDDAALHALLATYRTPFV